MIKFIYVLLALVLTTMLFVSFPEGATAVLAAGLVCVPILFVINKSEQKEFLKGVFALSLLIRLTLGLIIHIFELRETFGPDATNYNSISSRLVDIVFGIPVPDDAVTFKASDPNDVGWGMYYFTAGIYILFGKGIFIAQTICGSIGAATAPLVFFCAHKIFNNLRVARLSAMFVALFPCFIIWSSQLLKDGLIVFLLVLIMTLVIKLQERLNYIDAVLLVLSLMGIMALRFYIFYMVTIAVLGTFIIGTNTSAKSIFQRMAAIIIIGLGLTYFGVVQSTNKDIEQYADLNRIQTSRTSLVKDANSGFGEDIDVSTTEGAVAAIPIGLFYLMFAPFPWQAKNFVQVMVLPEVFLWWSLIPFMIYGIWYTLKNQLRRALPILIFTLMLSISYALFQGNAGMIYRQRTQIQVFFFIFISVGLVIKQEQRENKRMLKNRQIHGSIRNLKPIAKV